MCQVLPCHSRNSVFTFDALKDLFFFFFFRRRYFPRFPVNAHGLYFLQDLLILSYPICQKYVTLSVFDYKSGSLLLKKYGPRYVSIYVINRAASMMFDSFHMWLKRPIIKGCSNKRFQNSQSRICVYFLLVWLVSKPTLCVRRKISPFYVPTGVNACILIFLWSSK